MDNPRLIHIDWTSPGNDYLPLFPEQYPELAFLSGPDWEALHDDLATESPESVFDPLSGFLARHGYELWNADDGSDSYQLAIVKAGASADFEALIGSIANGADVPIDIRPERLGIEGARAAPKSPRKPRRKQPRFELIAETAYHREYGGLDLVRHTHRLVNFEENGDAFCHVADLTTFPFQLENDDAIQALLAQQHVLRALYTNGKTQYWTWTAPPEEGRAATAGQQIIAIDDFSQCQWRVVEGTAIGPDQLIYGEGIDDTAFVVLPSQTKNTRGRATALRRLCRIRDAVCTPIAEFEGSVAALLPLNRDEVIVSFTADETHFLLFDSTTGQQRRVEAVGEKMSHLFAVNEDEVGFVTRTTQTHAQVDYLREHVGHLNRLNLRDGSLRRAELSGLRNDYTYNPTLRRDQPLSKVKVASFDGFIVGRRGHDGWVVLNYLTTAPGKHDRAWFWNTATDEVVKITAKECPRLAPIFHHVPALGRYVADSSCRLDLLQPFEEIKASCPHGQLIWHEVKLTR